MKRLIYCILFLSSWFAQAQNYIDANGREWMRIDNTFSFGGILPSLCNPACSGIVTQYTYDVRTNSFLNPRQISLDGFRWADRDEAQALMNSIDLLSLGVSQQFVTTYSYSASVYASTSSLDPESGLRYIAYAASGHNMVSFSYGSGFVLGVTAVAPGARVGALLYRSRSVPKDCVYNGGSIPHGGSFTAYQSASVAYNRTCQSEVRTCSDGVISGTFTASSCTVTPPRNCTYNGQTVLHGQKVSGYSSTSATSLGTYGTFCSKFQITRTCIDGSFGGPIYPTCTQTVLSPDRCRIRDGAIKCKS